MGRGTRSWIVPDGLWEIARPLIPEDRVRPQGGGTQDTPDETLFAAIIYVLVGGCAWRALPPCFGISKSTAHRRFLIWSRAGVRGRLHEEILHRLDDAGLLDLSRAVLDSAHVRAEKKRGELTGPSPVDRGKPGSKMHVLSDPNGLPPPRRPLGSQQMVGHRRTHIARGDPYRDTRHRIPRPRLRPSRRHAPPAAPAPNCTATISP